MSVTTERTGAPRAFDHPEDLLGDRTRRRTSMLWTTGLSGLLVVAVLLGVGVGATSIDPWTVARIIAHHTVGEVLQWCGASPWPRVSWPATSDAIVWQVRFPRVVLGVLVGAGLAVCGTALQAMVRNVLADPYLLGINSGASSGAAAAILFGAGAGLGEYALQGSAFVGALAASMLVFVLARSGGRVTAIRLLLSGVAVGYALYAATSFLIFASDSAEGSRSVLFWLLGSLGLAQWNIPLAIVAGAVVLTVVVLTVTGRSLDALAVGDETAHTLGVSPERFRTALLVLVSLSIGVLVASAGSIGFVGLVVPHLARRLVGATHVRAVPVAALCGAILLVGADLVARTLLAPQEIPIGIITSLVGAPFLLILIRRMHATSA